MNGSSAATAEPSWLSSRSLLWLCLLVPLCTLCAPSSSSWGAGHWERATVGTHPLLYTRESTSEGAGGSTPACRSNARALGMCGFASSLLEGCLGRGAPERCFDWHQPRGDGRLRVCCSSPPAALIHGQASSCCLRAAGFYRYWEDWESIIKLSVAKWPLWRGRCSRHR